jgi:hypothetical protein
MKIKLKIDDGDLTYFDTFPDFSPMEGKIYNMDVEYYFKKTINEDRFRKIFGQIFSNR